MGSRETAALPMSFSVMRGKMDKIIKTLQVIIPFIEPYPYWVKTLIGIWVLLSAIVVVALLFAPKNISHGDSKGGKQEIKKLTGEIHQTAIGNNNVQLGTTGDNSPIIIDNRKETLENKVEATPICYKEPEGDFFITKIELYSKHPIPNIYIAAFAKTIVKFDVMPQRSGGHMSGHSGKRENFWFTNIPNFGGKYLLVVKTKESEEIKIEYDIN